MGNKACILDITQSVMPSTDELIWFVKPYFNGVFIQDCSILDVGHKRLYGDEISLSIWYMLKLNYGKPDGQHIWTLIDGYKYIYHAGKHEFNIYDEHGTIVYNVSDVKSIADMHIDFKVHKSHQFIIIIEAKKFKKRFIFSARLLKKTYGESPICNIIVTETRNKYRTDNRHDYETVRRLSPNATTRNGVFKINKELVVSEIYHTGQVGRLPRNQEYSAEINKLYDYNIKAFDGKHNKPIFKSAKLDFNVVLTMLSITMFPWLCPILRQDEFLNNRPVYEPWLIWGVYKILTRIPIDEDEEIVPEVLGFSPNWEY